jgi:hypothetical protein
MTREMSDLKNIAEATEVRKSGYATKVHSSPHKIEIDDWIITRRWSSNMISNELKRLYPKENHPSNRGIDNYRHKYLPKEFASMRAGKITDYPEQIVEEIMKQFNPAIEGVALWQNTKKVLEQTMDMMAALKIPPKILNDLLKTAGSNYSIVCEVFSGIGLIDKKPTELNLTTQKTYGGIEDIRQQFNELEGVLAALKSIKNGEDIGGEEDEDDRPDDTESGDAEGGDIENPDQDGGEGVVSEGHCTDGRTCTPVQEQPTPEGLVQNSGQQGTEKDSGSSTERTQ